MNVGRTITEKRALLKEELRVLNFVFLEGNVRCVVGMSSGSIVI